MSVYRRLIDLHLLLGGKPVRFVTEGIDDLVAAEETVAMAQGESVEGQRILNLDRGLALSRDAIVDAVFEMPLSGPLVFAHEGVDTVVVVVVGVELRGGLAI